MTARPTGDLQPEYDFDYSKAHPNRLAGRVDKSQLEDSVMSIAIQEEAPPLRRDSSGAVRVGSSRVLLELVIRAFEDGATPETIAQQYPTTTLADIYSVIAYYLRHRAEVDTYLMDRERQTQEVRKRIESQQGDLAEVRSQLLVRMNCYAQSHFTYA